MNDTYSFGYIQAALRGETLELCIITAHGQPLYKSYFITDVAEGTDDHGNVTRYDLRLTKHPNSGYYDRLPLSPSQIADLIDGQPIRYTDDDNAAIAINFRAIIQWAQSKRTDL